MIKHIVMWKFKENENERKQEFLDGLKSLYGIIPEIKFMEVKESAKKDAEFDACLISKFDNMEDLKKYKNDPRHVKVSNICKEIRTNRAQIDIED